MCQGSVHRELNDCYIVECILTKLRIRILVSFTIINGLRGSTVRSPFANAKPSVRVSRKGLNLVNGALRSMINE